jgi:hypothetical protein
VIPTRETARQWQRHFLRDLEVPDPRVVGSFRGEPGFEHIAVRVAGRYGVEPSSVDQELKGFESKLKELILQLDALILPDQTPDVDQLSAIIDVCAWVHAEWIRIHPFANGNGRTARLWANCIALRYGLPPFVRLRPRPNSGYGEAGARAMDGDWKPTGVVFHRLLNEFLDVDAL